MLRDEALDRLLADARQTYRPPDEPPLEAMWAEVERAHFGAIARGARRSLSMRAASWAAAATLVIGAGLGYGVAHVRWGGAPPGSRGHAGPFTSERLDMPVGSMLPASDVQVAATTSQYLGQTALLLAAVRREADGAQADRHFVAQAAELLSTTRLLLDSQAAVDPELRSLLEDLELVLAQVARLPARGRASDARQELELITSALDQRDVVPRLRSAAAGLAADLPSSASDD